MQLTVYAYNII